MALFFLWSLPVSVERPRYRTQPFLRVPWIGGTFQHPPITLATVWLAAQDLPQSEDSAYDMALCIQVWGSVGL